VAAQLDYCFAFNFTLRILALARDYAFEKELQPRDSLHNGW
jgi:hypothetical protein